MLAGCQPKLDALRALDKQTFEVPPHVLLIKDFALEHQVSEEEEKAKAAELEKLKLRYRQVTDANTSVNPISSHVSIYLQRIWQCSPS